MRLPGLVPATLLMVKLVPVDEVNVQTVGFAVGLRVNVRFWASGAVVRLLPPPGVPNSAQRRRAVFAPTWIFARSAPSDVMVAVPVAPVRLMIPQSGNDCALVAK